MLCQSSTTVSCVVDHVKPNLRDDKPDDIILRTGTNDFEKTSSQISKSVTELAMFQQSDESSLRYRLAI